MTLRRSLLGAWKLLIGNEPLTRGKPAALYCRAVVTDTQNELIRQKAIRKIDEMRSVMEEFTSHVECGIGRREELQRKADDYLKELDENSKKIEDLKSSDDFQQAVAKAEEMRTIINQFMTYNQEAIKRRMLMQEKVGEYIAVLNEYHARLQTIKATPNHQEE